MVEEDLFFPGKHVNDGEEISIQTNDYSTSSDDRNELHDDAFEQSSPKMPTTNTIQPTPPESNLPAYCPRSANKENEKEVNEGEISYDSPSSSLPTLRVPITIAPTPSPMMFPSISKELKPMPPLYRSISRSIQAEQSYSRSGIIGTPAGFGSSSTSLFHPLAPVNDVTMSRARSSSVQTTESKAGASSLNLTDSEPAKPTTKSSPFLLKVLTQTPNNPRDHSLLEIIWNEMLSFRWVNLSPLSVLTTYLEWHFKGTVIFLVISFHILVG